MFGYICLFAGVAIMTLLGNLLMAAILVWILGEIHRRFRKHEYVSEVNESS